MITTSSYRAQVEEEILFKFVADMPTKPSWRSPTSTSDLCVFWSQVEEEAIISLHTSSSTSSVLAIRNQIKTALCSYNWFSTDDLLVQFWAPTIENGGLTTSHQPFSITHMNEDLIRYRKHCVSHECGVGESIPGRAFRNQVNEYSQDVSYYSVSDYPLRELALSCGITRIMALPIFQHHSSVCVGVLELLFVSSPIFYGYVHSVLTALEREGLTSINPYKIQIPNQILEKEGVDQNHVTDEIRNALQHASTTYRLPLARAWVRYLHSTSTGDCGNLSCTGELVVVMPWTITIDDSYMRYYIFEYEGAAYIQAMRVGRGLLGNAFLSHKPYLCTDVTKLGMSEYPMAHSVRNLGLTSCFAVGLKSIATGNREYVLEFFLPKGRSDFHGLLSSILKILKQLLKSFVAVTGDPGDELFIEVDKSSFNTVFESSKTCPNIITHIESGALQNEGEVLQADFSGPQLIKKGSDSVGLEQSQVACLSKEKRLVKKSKAQDQKKESSCSYETLKQHFGMKLDNAAESLGVSRSTVKRWCRDNNIRRWPFPKRSKVCSAQPIPKQVNAPIQENAVPISESSGRDPSSSDLPTNLAPTQVASTMMVKATYRDDIIKFQLCFPLRMTDLMEKVILRLKLSEGTFNVKYQDDEGDYILLACDEDLQVCMNSLKLLKETPIKMLIQSITNVAH